MKSFSRHGALALSLLALTAQGTLAQGSNMNEEDLTFSAAPYGIIDNRNSPMNISLGTVESSYTRGQRDTTRRQIFGLNNAEIWKLLHCQMVKNGFEWTKPIGDMINTRTCAGVSAGNTLNNPRLIQQRRMVEEYLRGRASGQTSGSHQNQSIDAYTQFENISILMDRFAKKQNDALYTEKTNQEKYALLIDEMRQIHAFLRDGVHIEASFQHQIARHFITHSYKYTKAGIKTIEAAARSENFFLVTEYLKTFSDFDSNDYVFLEGDTGFDFYAPVGEDRILNNITLYPRTKYQGDDRHMFETSLELINAPTWMQLSHNGWQYYSLSFRNPSAKAGEKFHFQIKVTTKHSGKSFIQDASLTFVEKKTVVSGTLGVSGGKIVSPDKRYSVEVPANMLSRDHRFTLKISPETHNADFITSLEFENSISEREKQAFIVKNLDMEKFDFFRHSGAMELQKLWYFSRK